MTTPRALFLVPALLTALALCGCPEHQADDDATGDDDAADDDISDDDGGDDDGADDDTSGDDDTAGDDDTGDDDTVVNNPGPVRVMLVVDQGSFWQCTDSGNQRLAVIEQKVLDLLALPHVAVGYVLVGHQAATQAFTTTAADLDALWDPASAGQPASDWQGGLATAVDLIADDILTLAPVEVPYTRYVVVLITDSVPEPSCTVGCEDDSAACTDGVDNDQDGLVDGADPSCNSLELYGLCNYAGQIPPDEYVDFPGNCPSYNQETTLLPHVVALVGYELNPGVGDVTFHGRLASDPIPVVEAQCALEGHEQTHFAASGLLSFLAKAGGGTASTSGPGAPFLDGVDISALAMP